MGKNTAIEPFIKNNGINSIEVFYDMVFVINSNSRGWILDKICKKIEVAFEGNCYFCYTERNDSSTSTLPRSRAYFFSHYSLAFNFYRKYQEVQAAKCYLYFTHFDNNKGIRLSDLTNVLNHFSCVFTMNSSHKKLLEMAGIQKDSLETVVGGADEKEFTCSPENARKEKTIVISGSYYERKRPDLLLKVVKNLSEYEFTLVAPVKSDINNPGLFWENFPDFNELLEQPNFNYVEADYQQYPIIYQSHSFYLSLAENEGGPVSIIESMLCGCFPICTDTGFARDVFTNQVGVLLEIEDCDISISEKIRNIISVPQSEEIREQALEYTWDNKVQKIIKKTGFPEATLDKDYSFGRLGNGLGFLYVGWGSISEHGISITSHSSELRFDCSDFNSANLSMYFWCLDKGGARLDIIINGDLVVEDKYLNTERELIVIKDIEFPCVIELRPSALAKIRLGSLRLDNKFDHVDGVSPEFFGLKSLFRKKV